MTVLKTNNLKKRFGKFTALDGVNIEVNKGEVYGFIGPNGAGKSCVVPITKAAGKSSLRNPASVQTSRKSFNHLAALEYVPLLR